MVSQEHGTAEFTYEGRRMDARGALYYRYSDAKGTVYTPKKPMVSGHRPGAVVEVTWADEARTSYWTNGENRPSVARYLEDHPDFTTWQLQDRLAITQQERLRRIAKQERELDDPFTKAMSPLVEMYSGLRTRGERAAFIAEVMVALS